MAGMPSLAANSRQEIVCRMCFCRSSFAGETKSWWIDSSGSDSPNANARRRIAFTVDADSSSICLWRTSTPSNPIRAASSITCVIEYRGPRKCQKLYVETAIG